MKGLYPIAVVGMLLSGCIASAQQRFTLQEIKEAQSAMLSGSWRQYCDRQKPSRLFTLLLEAESYANTKRADGALIENRVQQLIASMGPSAALRGLSAVLPDGLIGREAGELMAQIGPPCVPYLKGAAEGSNRYVAITDKRGRVFVVWNSFTAFEQLGGQGKPEWYEGVEEALLSLLTFPDDKVRRPAAMAFESMPVSVVLPFLSPHANSSNALVRLGVARALEKKLDSQSIPIFLKLARDSSNEVREVASFALGEVGLGYDQRRAASEALQSELSSKEPTLVSNALISGNEQKFSWVAFEAKRFRASRNNAVREAAWEVLTQAK